MDELKIKLNKAVYDDDVEIYIAGTDNEKKVIATGLAFKERSLGEMAEPCMRINNVTAQKFMDELWDCGLRPTEGKGSAGSLKATEKHLEDMRKIAFNKLKIEA